MDGRGVTPFAFLFLEEEGRKPMIASYANGCFSILDTRNEQWQWQAKEAGFWGFFNELVDSPEADPEWKEFQNVKSAALFGIKARDSSNGMSALSNRLKEKSGETRKINANSGSKKRLCEE